MPLTSFSAKNLVADPFSIVSNAKPEMLFVVADLNFYAVCCRMPEGIAQRLRREPVNFVSQNRMQIPRCSFHHHIELG